MVLNLLAGYASPQYYLVFDDKFSTVSYFHSNNVPPHNWIDLNKNHLSCNEANEVNLQNTWFDNGNDKQGVLEEARYDTMRLASIGLTSSQMHNNEDHGNLTRNDMQVSDVLRTSEAEETSDIREPPNKFVNIETLGLRRSPRIQKTMKINLCSQIQCYTKLQRPLDFLLRSLFLFIMHHMLKRGAFIPGT